MITLYSFQPLHVLNELIKHGFYYPGLTKKTEYYPFSEHYKWMSNKMRERGVRHIYQNENLIWAYYQWYGVKKRSPDRRYSSVRYFYQDTPFILLTLKIPHERLLKSDYHFWHFILNNVDPYSCLCDNYDCTYVATEKEKEQAFEMVFDLELSKSLLSFEDHDYQQVIQATFYDLLVTDIKQIEVYKKGRCVAKHLMQEPAKFHTWYQEQKNKFNL